MKSQSVSGSEDRMTRTIRVIENPDGTRTYILPPALGVQNVARDKAKARAKGEAYVPVKVRFVTERAR